MSNLLRAAFLSGFGSLVQELGGDPKPLLQQAGLSTGAERDPDHFIPFHAFAQLLELSAEQLNCPDFGLRLSTGQGLPVLGFLSVLAGNLDDITSAFQAISRYMHLQIPAMQLDVQLDNQGRYIRILISVTELTPAPLAQFLEFIIGNGQNITHTLAGAKIPAQSIYFPHLPRAPKATYQRFFACELNFSQIFCAVDLPTKLISRPVQSADARVAELAVGFFASQENKASVDSAVIHLIHILLPTARCNIKTVARQLNMHPRSLQRKLEALDLVFEEILDQQRRVLAQRYLHEQGLSFSHITGLLGYADQSTLNRSCHRWFKATPKVIRTLLNSGDYNKISQQRSHSKLDF